MVSLEYENIKGSEEGEREGKEGGAKVLERWFQNNRDAKSNKNSGLEGKQDRSREGGRENEETRTT